MHMYFTWFYIWEFIQITEPGYIKISKPTEFWMTTSKKN